MFEGAVLARAEGRSAIELIPMGSNVFRADFDPTVHRTFTMKDGRATGFTLVPNGATMHAVRLGARP